MMADAIGRWLVTPEGVPEASPEINGFWDAMASVADDRAAAPGRTRAWWDRWIADLGALSAHRGGDARRALRAGAERMMRSGVDDPRSWAAVSERIVRAMDWRPGSGARIWLLGVLTDPEVRSGALSAFVRAMLTHSSAPGLDVSMALRADATLSEREELLETLRVAWRTDISGGDVRGLLMEQIRTRAEIAGSGLGREGMMRRAVGLARLNAACRRWAMGDEAGADLIVSMVDDPIELGAGDHTPPDLGTSRLDQSLTERIWNARDAEGVAAALDQMWRADRIGPWSAHAVINAAFRAPSVEVRERAVTLAQRHADEPTMLVAMDRVLATDRPNTRLVSVVAAVLDGAGASEIDQDADPIELRRRVHARLVASGVLGGEPRLGAFETEMRAAVALNLGRAPDDGSPGSARTPAALMRDVRERAASGVRIAGGAIPQWIEARRVIGAANARGGLERFAAEQAAALRVTAVWLWTRNPELEARLKERVRRADDALGDARDAVERIMMTEAAMLGLWASVLEMRMMS